LKDLNRMLVVYGIPFACFSVLSGLVQMSMALLPWFVYDLPFQVSIL
jgi:hypothetical protein